MTNLPLVSVITPSFNQASFLEATIRSVLAQDYPNLEYIVIDGGSTDESVAVIKKYSSQLAYWISEPDRGQANAINKGFDRASGQIYAWLNSDDLYLPHCVSTMVRFMDEHPSAGMAYGDVQVIDGDNKALPQPAWGNYELKQHLLHQVVIPQPAAFFRRHVVERVGHLREDLHYALDYEYWLRIGRCFPIKHCTQNLAFFRLYEANKSGTSANLWGAEFVEILDQLYAEEGIDEEFLRLKRRAYAAAYLHAASNSMIGLDMQAARASLWKATRTDPWVITLHRWWITLAKTGMGKGVNIWARKYKKQLRQNILGTH